MMRRKLRRPPTRPLRRMAGASLIELMIAVTIGMIILTAVALVFVNASSARNEVERTSRQIENGRYAIEVLSDDLRLAGFYGELSVGSLTAPTALPDPCSTTATDWNSAIQVHIQGYNGGSGAPTSCLPASLNFQPGTDILVVRRARTCLAGVSGCEAVATGKPYLQVSLCATEATSYVLGLEGTATFNLTKKNCTTAADKRQYYVNIYYVSTDNGAGQSIPTLKRLEFTGAGWTVAPLVEGIEQLNIEYGLDTNADGAPDSYVAAPASLADWMNVMSVKIYVLSRNLEATPGYTDAKTYQLGGLTYTPTLTSYRRHVYSALVRLSNPAGRRDTP